jgi:uncharacterized protein with GYD domain
MTDVPDQAELDTNRETARQVLNKAGVIVDSLLIALRDYDVEQPGEADNDLDRSALVTIALVKGFMNSPQALVTIASAAVIKLEKALSASAVTHLCDDR